MAGAFGTTYGCTVVATDSHLICVNGLCQSDTSRETGEQCALGGGNEVTDEPPKADPNTCASDDLYCKLPTGGCPAGFVRGTFSGEDLCIRAGTPATSFPSQSTSPLTPVPPGGASLDPGVPTRPGEAPSPGGRGVTGIGAGAVPGQGSNANPPTSGSTPPSGTGTGGSGVNIELKTCGRPGEPPCKIDETGTPDGATTGDDARKGIEDAAKGLETKLGQVVAGEGAPNASTGFFGSVLFPTTCTPFVLGNQRWGFYTLNFCQWQPVVHDLMTVIWSFFTILISLSMVFRTANATGA
jgi:hypothetical protein